MDIAELTRRILDRREGPRDPLRIVQAGHPALRRPAGEVGRRLDGALLRDLVEAMTVTMREAPGVGLAAPQVGLPLALFVLEDRAAGPATQDGDESPDDRGRSGAGSGSVEEGHGAADLGADPLERTPVPLRALLDPVVDLVGTQRVYAWEGCLSVDGWQSIVPRSRRVRLRATELLPGGERTPVDEEHVGWPARILQHETDHLRGVLCHDTMVPRSFVEAGYAAHYEQMPEAVRRLGLRGEITRLGEGEVVVG